MRISKIVSNLLLLLLTMTLIVYPQTGISNITIHAHPEPEQDQLFSYESVVQLLEELDNGILEEKCDSSDLIKIHALLADLAQKGILPGDLEAAFVLERDIYEFLHMDQGLYEYASGAPDGYIYSYDDGDLVLCKSWLHKKWDQVKKFVKKHKKEILVGAAIVSAIVIVAVIVVATGGAGAAAAGATGAAALGILDDDQRVKTHDPKPLTIEVPVLEEEVTQFKEWIAKEKFLDTELTGFPVEESGKILCDVFAEESLKKVGQSSFFGHSLDAYQLRGERALELRYYDQALSDFGKAIEMNPHHHEAYLSRAATHFELGDYDLCLKDYQQYTAKKPLVEHLEHIADFTSGFNKGLPCGIVASGKQLFSLGGQLLTHPINTVGGIFEGIYNLCKLACANEWGTIGGALSPEIRELVIHWDELSPEERGERAGHAFGKLGSDIVIPGVAAKSAKGAKELATLSRAFKMAEKTLPVEVLAQSNSLESFAKTASRLNNRGNILHSTIFPGFYDAEGVLIEHVGPEFVKQFKNAQVFLKPYSKTIRPEAEVRALIEQTGIKTFPWPKGMPDNFQVKISKKGGGMIYVHPENNNITVRVMPGKPHSPNPCQQKPYVIQRNGNMAVDKLGNLVEKDAIEAHIPLDEFVYNNN